jgi:hypothetical protein
VARAWSSLFEQPEMARTLMVKPRRKSLFIIKKARWRLDCNRVLA